MRFVVADFINHQSEFIDNAEWTKLMIEIYNILTIEEAEECVTSLISALEDSNLRVAQLEQFHSKFEDIVMPYYSYNKKMSLVDILDQFSNYFGMSYADAYDELLEDPDLKWVLIDGDYIFMGDR